MLIKILFSAEVEALKSAGVSKADQFDSPWKEALEVYLQSMLEFCFPRVAAAIDWKAGFEFLDKELQEIVRDAVLGPQRVDKLVKTD